MQPEFGRKGTDETMEEMQGAKRRGSRRRVGLSLATALMLVLSTTASVAPAVTTAQARPTPPP